MWWIYYVVLAAFAIYTYKKIPKPQSQKAPGFGDLKVPTAEEGRAIPVLFGTKLIKSPQVSWYGDFESVPIKSKGGKK